MRKRQRRRRAGYRPRDAEALRRERVILGRGRRLRHRDRPRLLQRATTALVDVDRRRDDHDDAASTSSTASSTTTTSTTTDVPISTRIEDPFHSASLAAYLATRTDNVTAALYNVTTHQIYIYRPGILQVTASMEKIDILAVLLWEHQNAHTPLTTQEQSLATKMIEYSDNNAAESLWVTIGQLPDGHGVQQGPRLHAVDHQLGLGQVRHRRRATRCNSEDNRLPQQISRLRRRRSTNRT